jgi:hypothetical protein
MGQEFRSHRASSRSFPIHIASVGLSSVLLMHRDDVASIVRLQQEAIVAIEIERGVGIAFEVELIFLTETEQR